MLSPEDLDVLKRTVIILRNQEEDAHADTLAEFIDEAEQDNVDEQEPSPDTHLGATEYGLCHWRDGLLAYVCTREAGHKGPHIAHRSGDDAILAIERKGEWARAGLEL